MVAGLAGMWGWAIAAIKKIGEINSIEDIRKELNLVKENQGEMHHAIASVGSKVNDLTSKFDRFVEHIYDMEIEDSRKREHRQKELDTRVDAIAEVASRTSGMVINANEDYREVSQEVQKLKTDLEILKDRMARK